MYVVIPISYIVITGVVINGIDYIQKRKKNAEFCL